MLSSESGGISSAPIAGTNGCRSISSLAPPVKHGVTMVIAVLQNRSHYPWAISTIHATFPWPRAAVRASHHQTAGHTEAGQRLSGPITYLLPGSQPHLMLTHVLAILEDQAE